VHARSVLSGPELVRVDVVAQLALVQSAHLRPEPKPCQGSCLFTRRGPGRERVWCPGVRWVERFEAKGLVFGDAWGRLGIQRSPGAATGFWVNLNLHPKP
jgi:hypothetical protein